MNVFSRQGRALPSTVRNQIIDKWLSNEGIANILQQINLPYKTVSNIVDFRVDNGDIFSLQLAFCFCFLHGTKGGLA